jgi:hypothetical protein
MSKKSIVLIAGCFAVGVLSVSQMSRKRSASAAEDPQIANAEKLIQEGRHTFRFDTFGDEAFWGDTLKLHQAVEGASFGGVGLGLSPKNALALGLKVDVNALLPEMKERMAAGNGGTSSRTALNEASLSDPATTLALLRANAVIGLTGVFNSSGGLQSIGIQCALCHSTVDNSIAPGIGRRLDGWANRDLNVGAIVSLAPNLQPVAELLGVDVATVKRVLMAWGPGKFDAELFLDGKGFRPDGGSAAVLIPPAFGLDGVNLHTWTGWGSVTHWNAFVANLEMHGKGRFFDPRLNNAAQFPIAAAHGFADLPHINPDDDLITKKLPALHFYQLSIAAPQPQPGKDFDPAAAKRGDELFSGKAKCNNCHVEPLWTEPGWNLHPAADVCIDDFQANRGPDRSYRTSPLSGIFTHKKGGFYHDGRFTDLHAVVFHYNTCMGLSLTAQEADDLVQYVLSL